MSNTGTISMLAGLVKGYTEGKDDLQKQELLARKETRDSMLQYLGHMINSPDVPAEHKQWAMQQIPLLAQHDITKKFPKGLGDLSTLPPVMLQQPPEQQNQTIPGNTPQTSPAGVQAPQPPPGVSAPAGAPTTAPGSTGSVGRASNGTVNALGQAPAAVTPPAPPPGIPAPIASVRTPPGGYKVGDPVVISGQTLHVTGFDSQGRPTLGLQPLGPAAAAGSPISRQPIQIPTPPQGVLTQGPTPPPEQLAPGGSPHILTTREKLGLASAAEQEEINRLQQQYPGKSREDLAYFTQHGEFPKPQLHEIPPGGMLVDATGNIVARNTEPRPGEKGGFEPKTGAAGEPMGVIDNAGVMGHGKGAFITPEQAKANPDAKATYDASVSQHQQRRTEQLEDQKALLDRQFALADEHEKIQQRKEGRAAIAKVTQNHDIDSDRLTIMEQNLQDGLKGNQQAMLSLLSNHVGMTLGLQKGARITRAFYEEAEQSAPILGRIEAHFDSNGYLSGAVLTPNQMTTMVELGRQKEAISRDRVSETQDLYSDVLKPGGKGAGKAQVEKPKPPKGAEAGGAGPHPTTHQWSASAWLAANPGGNVEAAKAAATKAGYEVVK